LFMAMIFPTNPYASSEGFVFGTFIFAFGLLYLEL
jgi:hypothetical protein